MPVGVNDMIAGVRQMNDEEKRALLRALRIPKKKIINPGIRTKLGLTMDEQRRLLEACPGYYTPLPKETRLDISGINSRIPEERIWQTVYLMMAAGMHRDVIAEPVKRELRFDGHSLMWNRPKKHGRDANTATPLPHEAREWIGDYLVWLRGRKRVSEKGQVRDGGINSRMLNRILRRLGLHMRYHPPGRKLLSTMTLRHTYGVNLARRGVPYVEIASLMNCSLRVAQGYAKEATEQMEAKLDRMGALAPPGSSG